MTFDEFDEDAEVFQEVEVVEEEIVDDEPFLIVETMPSFQGGDLNTFRNWVQSNVRFPQIALENGISGTVVLSFVIEKDGRLTNIQVLRTPDRSLSEEAVRVLEKSPKWTPGKQRNQVVRVKYNLPVVFRVQN
jgi:protein TonB